MVDAIAVQMTKSGASVRFILGKSGATRTCGWTDFEVHHINLVGVGVAHVTIRIGVASSANEEGARIRRMSRLLCILVICSFFSASLGDVTVRVDPENGNDTLCLSAMELIAGNMNTSSQSCRTINYALLGDSWTSYTTLRGSNCSEVTQELRNVRIVLADGEHHLLGRLMLAGDEDITLEAENRGQASVQCASFPNNISGNFDNIAFCNVAGIRLVGVVFEKCGPVPSNVFVLNSSNIEITECTFK